MTENSTPHNEASTGGRRSKRLRLTIPNILDYQSDSNFAVKAVREDQVTEITSFKSLAVNVLCGIAAIVIFELVKHYLA
jgi:hypothetical protein